jgi:hypothetical protein
MEIETKKERRLRRGITEINKTEMQRRRRCKYILKRRKAETEE